MYTKAQQDLLKDFSTKWLFFDAHATVFDKSRWALIPGAFSIGFQARQGESLHPLPAVLTILNYVITYTQYAQYIHIHIHTCRYTYKNVYLTWARA